MISENFSWYVLSSMEHFPMYKLAFAFVELPTKTQDTAGFINFLGTIVQYK